MLYLTNLRMEVQECFYIGLLNTLLPRRMMWWDVRCSVNLFKARDAFSHQPCSKENKITSVLLPSSPPSLPPSLLSSFTPSLLYFLPSFPFLWFPPSFPSFFPFSLFQTASSRVAQTFLRLTILLLLSFRDGDCRCSHCFQYSPYTSPIWTSVSLWCVPSENGWVDLRTLLPVNSRCWSQILLWKTQNWVVTQSEFQSEWWSDPNRV